MLILSKMSQANYHDDKFNVFPSFYSNPFYAESVKAVPGRTSIHDLHRSSFQNTMHTRANLPKQTARNYLGYKMARTPNNIDISKDPRGGFTGLLTSAKKVPSSPGPEVQPQRFLLV
jgi:hypothetical protein